MPSFIAYYRRMTHRRRAMSVDEQAWAVTAYLDATYQDNEGNSRWSYLWPFTEQERRGNQAARPQLMKAFVKCREHKATLIVARMPGCASFACALRDSGVAFVILDYPDVNRETIASIVAQAEYEAGLYSKYNHITFQQAIARGVKFGRPNVTPEAMREIQRLGVAAWMRKHRQWQADVVPLIHEAKAQGARTLREIAAELNNRGSTTYEGTAWSQVQVWRVLRRIAKAA